MTNPDFKDRDPSVNNRLADALFSFKPGVQVQQITRVGPGRFEVFYINGDRHEHRYISDGLPEILDHPAPVVSPA